MPAHDLKNIRPNVYHDFHNMWIAFIMTALNNGILPRDYVAICERDLEETKKDASASGTSVSESPNEKVPPKPPVLAGISSPRTEFVAQTDGYFYGMRRKTLAVRHVDGHRVVALLEVLSKSNKSSPAQLQKLISKTGDALSNGIHVSIVDPYPPNKYAPCGIHGSLWQQLGEEVSQWPIAKPYTAAAYASGGEIEAYAQPYGVGENLPELPLFLSPTYHVNVPLEKTYMEAFHSMPDHWRDKLQTTRTMSRKK